MAESVDATDLKSVSRKGVGVQVPLSVPLGNVVMIDVCASELRCMALSTEVSGKMAGACKNSTVRLVDG